MRGVNQAGRLLVVLAILALAGCREQIPMPEEMVGTWVTPDQRFHGRSLGLTPHQVSLGTGGKQAQRHAIDAIYASQDGDRTLYTVVYRTSYGEDSLVLYREGDAIVFKNQRGVRWFKGDSRR